MCNPALHVYVHIAVNVGEYSGVMLGEWANITIHGLNILKLSSMQLINIKNFEKAPDQVDQAPQDY